MDKTNQISSNPADPIIVNPEFGRLEYNALRETILKRLEIIYNLLNWTLLLAGAFLAAGIQSTVEASVLFVYPILALCMAANWKYNITVLIETGEYIREHIERPLGVKGWQYYLREKYQSRPTFGHSGNVSVGALIVGTQVCVILISCMKSMPITAVDWLLFGMSITATGLTIIVLYQIWRAYKKLAEKISTGTHLQETGSYESA